MIFNTVVAKLVYSRILEVFHFPGGIPYMAAGAWGLIWYDESHLNHAFPHHETYL